MERKIYNYKQLQEYVIIMIKLWSGCHKMPPFNKITRWSKKCQLFWVRIIREEDIDLCNNKKYTFCYYLKILNICRIVLLNRVTCKDFWFTYLPALTLLTQQLSSQTHQDLFPSENIYNIRDKIVWLIKVKSYVHALK